MARLMPTSLRCRQGVVWLYQFGEMYADPSGRTLRHIEDLT